MENFTISANIYFTLNMIKNEMVNESCYVLVVLSDRTISEMWSGEWLKEKGSLFQDQNSEKETTMRGDVKQNIPMHSNFISRLNFCNVWPKYHRPASKYTQIFIRVAFQISVYVFPSFDRVKKQIIPME